MRFVTSVPDICGNALEPSREQREKKTKNCHVCVVLCQLGAYKAERKEKSSNSSLSHTSCFHRVELCSSKIGGGK